MDAAKIIRQDAPQEDVIFFQNLGIEIIQAWINYYTVSDTFNPRKKNNRFEEFRTLCESRNIPLDKTMRILSDFII